MALAFGLLTLGAIAGTYILVAIQRRSVQDRVPHHFNLRGQPDSWGSGLILWLYPSFSLVFAAGIAAVIVALRPRDPKAVELLAGLCAWIAVLNFALTERSIAVARKRATGLGWMFLPCVAIGIALLVWHYS